MRKLSVYNSVSLDGYFTDKNSDMSWAHKQDPEWNAFVADNASSEGELVFGRKTYEMMASYWTSPEASRSAPTVAEGMNNLPKIVISRTLDKPTWKNTKLVNGDLPAAIKKMKGEPGFNMVIMGSGTIVAQLTDARLIDEYQIVLNSIVLGSGRTLFEGVRNKLNLRLTKSRAFQNGNVVLWYEPAA
jgi:dihydrofolate reductase